MVRYDINVDCAVLGVRQIEVVRKSPLAPPRVAVSSELSIAGVREAVRGLSIDLLAVLVLAPEVGPLLELHLVSSFLLCRLKLINVSLRQVKLQILLLLLIFIEPVIRLGNVSCLAR